MIDEMQDQGAPMDAGPEPTHPDGGDPAQAIGYIPDEYSAKEKTYLAAARQIIVNDQTAQLIKRMLSSGNDPTMTLAMFIGKTVDALETKLGPLTDDEHDHVCLVIAGWLASSMQALGMPGMDDPGGRQDFMGRVLQQLDGLTKGAADTGAPPTEGSDQGAPPGAAAGAPPLGQFGGGP